jgi:hypothetical protein
VVFTWPALLVAPALALADQVIAYAAVGWACAHDRAVVVHAIHAAFFFAVMASLWPAWRAWTTTHDGGDEAARRRHFLAGLAIASAALSALVIAAMWLPAWVIAPCTA